MLNNNKVSSKLCFQLEALELARGHTTHKRFVLAIDRRGWSNMKWICLTLNDKDDRRVRESISTDISLGKNWQ